MSFPAAWVDRIFEKLTMVYGHQFLGRWSGLDLEAVKADWGRELARFQQNPAALAYALDNLPANEPPNVLEFRALCNRRPDENPTALPAPDPAGLKRVSEALSGLAIGQKSLAQHAEECFANLRQLEREGRLSAAQRDFLQRAKFGPTDTVQSIGEFTPVPDELLPPEMRKGRPDDGAKEAA